VPTWTQANSITPTYFSFASFGSNPTPTRTANLLLDWSTCSNGAAVSTTCGGTSTFTGWFAVQDSSAAGAGATTCTSPIGSSLPATTTINGVQHTGSSTIDFCGVTSTSGTNIGYYDVTLPYMGLMSTAVGFTIESTCPANVECGSTVRLVGGTEHASLHLSPLGDGHFCLESTGTGGGCSSSEGGTYAANTAYRVNFLTSGYTTAGADKMVVCTDGPGGSVLVGSITGPGTSSQHYMNELDIGLTGEEPTTSGYHYYIRNIVVAPGDLFSTAGCF